MLKKTFAAALVTLMVASPVFAEEHEHGDVMIAKAAIKEIRESDSSYVAEHNTVFFNELAKGQHPRTTVVTCSDSRVHTNMLDKTPEGDLFVIRNIGNQLATAKGSVEYGVNHLSSSLLLFIGHSSCGAIKAASGDYSSLEPDIKKELDTIKIPKGISSIDGVKMNVNSQVADAVKEWDKEVKDGHLMVVGAIYDFSDDMKEGPGKLNIININGEIDPAKIKVALEK